jgi:O-antigen/teichoic acid export membrane protein
MAAWRLHRDLLGNAGTLVASTGVASVLGFVYWLFAARVFSQQAVGYGSAAVSAMTMLGTFGMLGLGTLLIGELPRRHSRAGLVSAALLTCGLGSLVLGLAFVIVAPHLSPRFADMLGTPGQAALFAAGVAVTGVTLVFDQATIGLMRGGLQLWRNVAFAIVKLLALPAAAIVLHDEFGVGITLSWVAGAALSLVLVAARLRIAGAPVLPRPDWGVLRGLGKTAMAHNWLNLAMTMPFYLLPVLVTLIVSPSANAAFYIALMLSTFLFIVPAHLSTVLFAVVAADPQVIARKLRFALRLSFMIGLPGMAVLILGAHLALGLFGPGYAAEATLPLWLITLGYPAAVPKALYIAVFRAQGRIPRAALVLTTCSTLEVAAAVGGGIVGGLVGLSWALLAVRYAEALVTAPPVIRAAFGHGRHRRTEPLAGATGEPQGTRPVRQTAGDAG